MKNRKEYILPEITLSETFYIQQNVRLYFTYWNAKFQSSNDSIWNSFYVRERRQHDHIFIKSIFSQYYIFFKCWIKQFEREKLSNFYSYRKWFFSIVTSRNMKYHAIFSDKRRIERFCFLYIFKAFHNKTLHMKHRNSFFINHFF